MRIETISLAAGMTLGLALGSSGLVVAALSCASALSLALDGLRGVKAIFLDNVLEKINDPARRWKLRPGQTRDRRRSKAGAHLEQDCPLGNTYRFRASRARRKPDHFGGFRQS